MVAPLLEARSLLRRYAARTVVDIERIHVERGEVLAIVGPNGAGKSTLFRLLLALERPDAGSLLLDGAAADAAALRARTAGVFQRPILFSGSVADNVSYGLRVRGVPRGERERRVQETLHWFELDAVAGADVHRLSGGEVQRVALARALVLEPEVLLLDEPTANLDVAVKRRFRADLERIARQRARGIILITHDATEAVALADRVAVMHHGRVVRIGSPSQLVLQPDSPFVAALTGAELLLHGSAEVAEDGLCAVRVAEDTVVWALCGGPDAPQAGDSVIVGYRPEDVLLMRAGEHAETSAVNRIETVVESTASAGGFVRVVLRSRSRTPLTLHALITRRSAGALQVEAGTALAALIKATALHAWRHHAWHDGDA